ncbi:MAG: alpha/beta hydrolase [Candidatus Acidiferrum sp.]
MATITTKDGTTIFYKDWGKGQPIVFSHGWPLSADDWDGQMLFFGQRGYRVIAHAGRNGRVRGDHGMATTWTPMPTISPPSRKNWTSRMRSTLATRPAVER